MFVTYSTYYSCCVAGMTNYSTVQYLIVERILTPVSLSKAHSSIKKGKETNWTSRNYNKGTGSGIMAITGIEGTLLRVRRKFHKKEHVNFSLTPQLDGVYWGHLADAHAHT